MGAGRNRQRRHVQFLITANLITPIHNKMTPIDKQDRDPLTEKIIGCCYKVHNELGAGFTERIYHNALMMLLQEDEIAVQTEKEFEVRFRNRKIGKFRCDLVVEEQVIVELKSTEKYMPKIFEYQLLSYLKASGIKTGLLINFGNTSCEVKRLSV